MSGSSTNIVNVGHQGPPIDETIPTQSPNLHAMDLFGPPTKPGSLGRIGHYEVLELLGRGGFGIVVRALDDVLHRNVAIKILAPMYVAVPSAQERFLREARSAAAIRHDHVVQVYSIHETPVPYLVMEYIPGQTLQQWIDRGQSPIDEVVQIGIQLAKGLAAAHAQGLIHRDVKPANVLLEQGAGLRAKITDFGLARTAHDSSLSVSGFVAGTPLYMAPEQTCGEPLDQRTDLFSLGSVLYTMLTGQPPFQAATQMAVMRLVCDRPSRPIRELRPDVPEALVAIINKLHAKDRHQRFETANEVAAALTQLREPPATPHNVSQWRLWMVLGIVAAVLLTLAVLVAINQFERHATPITPVAPNDTTPVATPSDRPAAKTPSKTRTVAEVLRSLDEEWSVPVNLGPNINTDQRELTPTLTSDERTIIFYRHNKFYMSQRASTDEEFGPAELLPDGINNRPRESPTITGDGLVLVFASYRGRTNTSGLWMSQRASIKEPFGEPVELPEPVRSAGGWEGAPVLSADGLTLFATSARFSTAGRGKIYMFTRSTRAETFGKAVELPAPINSTAYAIPDWLSPDGTVLIVTRSVEKVAEARFFVRSSVNEPFGQAQTIDTLFDRVGMARPWLSPDGQRIYFHSRDIAGGYGNLDLWMCRRVPKK